MDCDFIEHEYYFSHLWSHGDNPSDVDGLSWLVYPTLVTDPPEQRDNVTKIATHTEQTSHSSVLVILSEIPLCEVTYPIDKDNSLPNDSVEMYESVE